MAKRIYRELPDATKEKISASLRNRMMDPAHRAKISKSMEEYWASIPSRDGEKNKSENPQPDGIV